MTFSKKQQDFAKAAEISGLDREETALALKTTVEALEAEIGDEMRAAKIKARVQMNQSSYNAARTSRDPRMALLWLEAMDAEHEIRYKPMANAIRLGAKSRGIG